MCRHDLSGVDEQCPAVTGRAQRVSVTDQQRSADTLLKPLDLPAHRGLRQAEMFGRPGHPAPLEYCDKCAERFDIELHCSIMTDCHESFNIFVVVSCSAPADAEDMNIASPHLRSRTPFGTLRRPAAHAQPSSRRRITMPRAHFTAQVRRFDDRPGFERNASPSDLVLRQASSVHSLHR